MSWMDAYKSISNLSTILLPVPRNEEEMSGELKYKRLETGSLHTVLDLTFS